MLRYLIQSMLKRNSIILLQNKNKENTIHTTFCFLSLSLMGQENIIFSNTKSIEKNRYPEIKGNPYYYKDFVSADMLLKNGGTVESILINFNAYEGDLELVKD